MYSENISGLGWAPSWVDTVVVVEGGEHPDDVIEFANFCDAVTGDADGDLIYWVIFAEEPKLVCDYSERCLREDLSAQIELANAQRNDTDTSAPADVVNSPKYYSKYIYII